MALPFENLHNALENRLIKSGYHRRPLGRTPSEDRSHISKWSIAPLVAAGTQPRVPIVVGFNWYSDFDNPVAVADGKLTRYFVAPNGIKGSIRGGHCFCLKPGQLSDTLAWWNFYDQGEEGACVGFGNSRMMTLLNRIRYDAFWLWDWGKMGDEWADTNPGDDNGTSVHAGADVLLNRGHVRFKARWTDFVKRDAQLPDPRQGLSAIRWATTVDEVRAVLQSPLNDQLQAVPFLNSWGRYYPHITWMPYVALERLIEEDGEVGIPTDR